MLAYTDIQQSTSLLQTALRMPTLGKYLINGSETFTSRAFISIAEEKRMLVRRPAYNRNIAAAQPLQRWMGSGEVQNENQLLTSELIPSLIYCGACILGTSLSKRNKSSFFPIYSS